MPLLDRVLAHPTAVRLVEAVPLALIDAAAAGNLPFVARLLAVPDVDPLRYRREFGKLSKCALSAAAGQGHVAVVERLLADPRAQAAGVVDTATALKLAAAGGHAAVVDRLLGFAAGHPEPEDVAAALCLALRAGEEALVSRLTSSARFRAEPPPASVLMTAAACGNMPVLELVLGDGRLDLKQLLEPAQAAFDAASASMTVGTLAMETACAHGQVEVVSRLLADDRVDAVRFCERYLRAAAAGRHRQVVFRLLRERAFTYFVDGAQADAYVEEASRPPSAKAGTGAGERRVDGAGAGAGAAAANVQQDAEDVAGEASGPSQLAWKLTYAQDSGDALAYVHRRGTRLTLLQAASECFDGAVAALLGDPLINPRQLQGALLQASRRGHASVVERLLADPRVELQPGRVGSDRWYGIAAAWEKESAAESAGAFESAAHFGQGDALEVLLSELRVRGIAAADAGRDIVRALRRPLLEDAALPSGSQGVKHSPPAADADVLSGHSVLLACMAALPAGQFPAFICAAVNARAIGQRARMRRRRVVAARARAFADDSEEE